MRIGERLDAAGRLDSLTTERLVLEPWHERHRPEWRRLCSDAAMMRYIGLGVTWSRAQADAAFDEVLEHWQAHGFGWRSPLDRETGEWLGFAALNHVGPGTAGIAEDEVEIGWSIVRRAWGRGYAKEAGAALRDEAFGRLGLERVVARLQPANVASARVALALGMHLERETTGRHGEALHIYARIAGRPAPKSGMHAHRGWARSAATSAGPSSPL